jgi:hypothetical protein
MQVFNPNIGMEVKSFTWEKRGKGKQMSAWIGTEKCKTEAAKTEGLSKG